MLQRVEKKDEAHYVANIDLLRGVAVLSVFAHHAFALTGFRVPYLDQAGGLVGVQLFFILSGYLISESATNHAFSAYAVHRFFRIFPAYWVALLLVGVMGPMTWNWVVHRPLGVLLSAVNLQQLDAVALLELDVLHVTWTLTVEVIWYVIAPLVLLAYRRHAWLTWIALACLSVGWSLAATHHVLDPLYSGRLAVMTQPVSPGQYDVLVGAAFPAQLVFFGMGALVYRYREQARRLSAVGLFACMFFCIVVLDELGAYGTSPPIPLGIGLTAFFILLLRARPIRIPILVRMGKISYSIYLLHVPVLLACMGRMPGAAKWQVPTALLVVTLVAHVMYTLIERPCMGVARQLLSRRTGTPVRPA